MLSLRTTIIALAALVACTADAAALTISPTGAYQAVDGQPVSFVQTSTQQRIVCQSASKRFTLDAAGNGTVPAGTALYVSCTGSGLFACTVTVTQTSAWTVQTTLLPSPLGVALTFTIPSRGLQFALPGGCTFTLGGTFTKLAAVAGLPATISSLTVVADTLRVTSNTIGPCASAIPLGLAADYVTALTLSPSMTVSG